MKIAAEKDPQISKKVRAFLKEVNGSGDKPMEELSPEEARKVLEGAQKSEEEDYSSIETEEKNIQHHGFEIKLHIVRPKGSKDLSPVFLFFHGGGWVIGDFPTHKRLVRDLVVASGFTCVFPDYSLSPEAKFPQAIEEAYAATDWVAKNGKEINVDGSSLAVVGNSAGGNMAAVVCLLAKERSGPSIAMQALLWPVTDTNFENDSYQQFGSERFLTTNMMKWFWNHYIAKESDLKNPKAAILRNDIETLKGLPPALVQVAENDVLRDEGIAFGRKLDEAGVPVSIMEYKGMIHDWGLLNALKDEKSTTDSVHDVAHCLKIHLGKSKK